MGIVGSVGIHYRPVDQIPMAGSSSDSKTIHSYLNRITCGTVKSKTKGAQRIQHPMMITMHDAEGACETTSSRA